MEIVVPGLVNDTQYQVRQFVKQKDGRVNDLLKGAYACAAPAVQGESASASVYKEGYYDKYTYPLDE